ncbi:hypothetical protein T552_01135 [Pneumocystis carinii B80]|uniref:PH domain-containing protein n=1 Tax=Pneumocystis carinii (strain B80) TaxID=1408658 RepID=A0A0W4ZLB6_PNEC8|nr:hypothetical protein T552_01135 [Pneumocystis carinii B80]KTW29178.1 hypothetical protein T552_01135 [Pneumocystis carinii B80]
MGFSETAVLRSEPESNQENLPDMSLALKENLSRDAHYNNLDSIFSSSFSRSLDPTKNLASRFSSWKILLKELIIYFKAVINIEEVKANEFRKLGNILSVHADKSTFRDGGIQDVEKVFCDWNRKYSTHLSTIPNSVNQEIISKLEKLRAMLTLRVKDILKMSSQFRNNLGKEADTTKKLMEVYKQSLLRWESTPYQITSRTDPYIIKLSLERQITQTLFEENALHQAYLNIENYCRNIEKSVINTVREVFGEYKNILQREVTFISDFNKNIVTTDDSISLDRGWNNFLREDSDSVNFRKLRYFCDLLYAQNHPAVKEIRSGILQRRSGFFRSFSSRFYVLTPSGFLHEFKSDNFSFYQAPKMSLCLRECEICEHSSADSQTYKFSLKGSKKGNSDRNHKIVFRTNTYDDMIDWYNNIKKFTGLFNMPENEFRDYIVALQVGNSADDQARDAPNDASDKKEEFSLPLKDGFKDDIDIMTSLSSAFYETLSSEHNGRVDDAANKEDINKDHVVNENGDLNKDNSSGEKNGTLVCLNGDITSGQEKSEKDLSADTSALLDNSGTCANVSIGLKDTTFKSLSRSSYSSTNEYSCPMEIQNSSLDNKSNLGESAVDTQKDSNQKDQSCSLYPVAEFQANNNQESCSLPSLGLSQSSLLAATQSKFKEDLGRTTLSNLDTSDVSDNKLDSEQVQSPKNIELANKEDNISDVPSDKALDGAESCSRKSLVKPEYQSLSAVSGLEVLEESDHKELKENQKVLDDNDYSTKELHKSDKDGLSKNV